MTGPEAGSFPGAILQPFRSGKKPPVRTGADIGTEAVFPVVYCGANSYFVIWFMGPISIEQNEEGCFDKIHTWSQGQSKQSSISTFSYLNHSIMGPSNQKAKNTPKHSSRKRVEMDEGALQEMLLGRKLAVTKVAQESPKQDNENPTAPEEAVQETESEIADSDEKAPVDAERSPDNSGFQRKKVLLPDFEQTFFAPVRCANERSAIYVSNKTKHRTLEVVHLLGNDHTRLTALVDNMLRFVLDLYSDELNYLHTRKNNRKLF